MAEASDGRLTRRSLLRHSAAGAGALALPGLGLSELVERAAAIAPAGASLNDIDHVVILVQENRSFDSYFGSFHGVRGFADPAVQRLGDGSGLSVFAQPGYPAPGFGGHLYPFHLDTQNNGECTNDITHDWGPQHRSLGGGRMDGFVSEHVKSEGASQGAVTMGYYKRADLPFYYALADAFTICDNYHCSVLGPTDPNQLMLISATLDPSGRGGGPLVETEGANRAQFFGKFSWTTMPEQLQARGISWKAYSGDNSSPEEDSPLPLFAQYYSNPTLRANGLGPVFPTDFQNDCANGTLPAVSWIWANIVDTEHPPAPVTWGEYTASQVLGALVSKPEVWARTLLLITWDENGGFFDHVAPPTPPPGTPGEYLTVDPLPAAAQGIAGPIGLGFRVPLLVASPLSRGGFVSSDLFDHTSLLRLLESRFGAEVPNLSAWRRSVCGDLQSALNFAAPDASVPALPQPSLTDPRVIASDCTSEPASLLPGAGSNLPGYPVPPNQLPTQEPGSPRRPSGPLHGHGSKPSGRRGSGGHRHAHVLRIRLLRLGGPQRGRRRVLIDVSHSNALRHVAVYVDGRRVALRRGGRFTVSIARSRTRRHRRLTISARDVTGAHAKRTLHLLVA